MQDPIPPTPPTTAAPLPPPPPPRPKYPVNFSVDYPDRELNRVSTLLRIFYLIPIVIIMELLVVNWAGYSHWGKNFAIGSGIITAPLALMILFRQKYPRWWFDWQYALSKFTNRVYAYGGLLRDEYPSTDEEQAVHLELTYPDVPKDLNRWLPLVKWLLAVPHYIVLFALFIAVLVVTIIAWFSILFTGRYPRELFDFVVGVMRWTNRVSGYAFLLVTDEYPPFRLSE